MKSKALKSSIFLVNAILATMLISLLLVLSTTFYRAYSLNEVFLIEFLDTGMGSYSHKWMFGLKLILVVMVYIAGIYVFWLLRKTLIHIKQKGPFDASSVQMIKKILEWVIIYGVIRIISVTAVEMINGSLKITISTTWLIIFFLVSIIYILVDIFKYGHQLQSDQNLTI